MKDKAALGCQATFGKTRRIRRTQTYKRTVFADRNRRLVGALAVEQTAVAWFIMASCEYTCEGMICTTKSLRGSGIPAKAGIQANWAGNKPRFRRRGYDESRRGAGSRNAKLFHAL
jgi:hypothetical protein